MRHLKVLCAVIAASFVFLGTGMPAHAAEATAPTPPAFLFVFDGAQATVSAVANQPGTFTFDMPIRKGGQLVTWFTDRPNRNAGHMSMKTFAGLWNEPSSDGFKADPPNVAISAGPVTAVATMQDPKIVTDKSGRQTLHATMVLVKPAELAKIAQSDSQLATFAKQAKANAVKTKTLTSVGVFVDDSTTCSGWQGCFQWCNSVPGASCTISKS